MQTRPAQVEDLPQIADITRATRQQLASWSPVYFNPRAGADELHAGWLEFLIESGDHETNVFTMGDDVVGFWQVVRQPSHAWVDDLCIRDPRLWEMAASMVSATLAAQRWVTCVSRSDSDRRNGLVASGMTTISTYWSRLLQPGDAVSTVTDAEAVRPDVEASTHTFGGRPFDAELPGALVVGDADGNYAIGSPGVEPPIYDPGGPTCVVDRVGGPDRGAAVGLAIAGAASRGDAQLVVVAATRDELEPALREFDFRPQVDLFGCE